MTDNHDLPATLGFLGAGHFTSYVVAGLRNAGDERPIVLSPRNHEVSASLAQAHGCSVASSNQAVIDRSDVVMLAVRPHHSATLLEELTFRPDQLVLSGMADVTIETMRGQGRLPDRVVRCLPNPSSEFGAGAIPVYPVNSVAERLLAPLGVPIGFDDESLYDESIALMCVSTWMYALIEETLGWAANNGFPEELARALVINNIRGPITLAERNPGLRTGEIVERASLEGTYALRTMRAIRGAGGFDSWRAGLDAALNKARGN